VVDFFTGGSAAKFCAEDGFDIETLKILIIASNKTFLETMMFSAIYSLNGFNNQVNRKKWTFRQLANLPRLNGFIIIYIYYSVIAYNYIGNRKPQHGIDCVDIVHAPETSVFKFDYFPIGRYF